MELDTPADPEAAERARAVQVAEDAAAAEVAAAGEPAEAEAGAPGTSGETSRTPNASSDVPVGATEKVSDAPDVATEKDSDDDGSASVPGKDGANEAPETESEAPKPAKRRRAPKLDALLAADVDVARKALLEVAPEDQIGEHAGVKAEDDRVVTHLFESYLPGYNGWQWFAVLTRVPRGKAATVSEVGLLPSEHSVLAPEWVPWAKRVRPEEKQQEEADQAEEDAKTKQESQSADK